MAKKEKKDRAVDEFLDALVWMRRKAKKHEAVDDLIDALIKMRRKAKKKAAHRAQTQEGQEENGAASVAGCPQSYPLRLGI